MKYADLDHQKYKTNYSMSQRLEKIARPVEIRQVFLLPKFDFLD